MKTLTNQRAGNVKSTKGEDNNEVINKIKGLQEKIIEGQKGANQKGEHLLFNQRDGLRLPNRIKQNAAKRLKTRNYLEVFFNKYYVQSESWKVLSWFNMLDMRKDSLSFTN